MSVETVRQRYVFTPVVGAPRKVPRPPWKHNLLHDLDSVWWISVWAVMSFKDEQEQRISSDEKHFGDLLSGPQVGQQEPSSFLRDGTFVQPVHLGDPEGLAR